MRLFLLGCLLLLSLGARAQQPDTARPGRQINLSNVDVAPAAVDISGWLLLDKDIQTELEGAVQNIYNFKHDRAERQFRSLRRRYPNHPMPYFLLGLTTWWKIMPSNITSQQYDKVFLAYMDTAITRGEALYKRDRRNYEACFFLSAAYGFSARLNAERHNWRKATVASKNALDYLEKSQEANGLSPEFLFGQALINYYAPWISDTYPLLRPVLLFFPKGNKKLGLSQLRSVAANGFYTAPEARVFLMKILQNQENKPDEALALARIMATTYPDNGYFQRFYALMSYQVGDLNECERVSRDILDKINRGMPGYEGISGRYATYFLGSLMQNQYKDLTKAKEYYQRCIVFAESTNDTKQGFYLYALLNLGRIASKQNDAAAATRYYKEVQQKAERKSEAYNEAQAYLKKKGKKPAKAAGRS
ncbi:tetratricopeptide (TPR) repeat protein [Hymenobacter luteus]|uniref:Tetratricopeptide (TPR) repeat protein n=2 Tax=Hymenobacter TaxID=89966 RepID=A0A7W9WAI6_9BACT|nr:MULTISPECIES: tetratricopeptide repeat protein [Hymenobacter]MBB4599722.1 tetratricopeptide (TPR) repeat protein [Hymenobacter latericoloratus]MBB6057968.1 tetratricopeptide (TPR) repeat protein [Hymenobacter luteus]